MRLSDVAEVIDGEEDIHNLGLYLNKGAGPSPPGAPGGRRGGAGRGGGGGFDGGGFGGAPNSPSNSAGGKLAPANSAATNDAGSSKAAAGSGAAGPRMRGAGPGGRQGGGAGGGGFAGNPAFFGQPAVIVQVPRQPGANIISTVDRMKARIPAVEAALPGDIHMDVAVDRTTTIRASLAEVERTVLISTLLVVAVVAFFLRNGRAVLIPSVAVAVSLLGTLGVMFLLGFSLDNLSLMALTVSTGFVVDDAIVVLENITRHLEAGMDRFEAALKGAEEVGFTVLSISVSLIAVFMPILLMGGIIGRLFREFALTLSTAILVSLVISLTTTPMLCAYFIGAPKPPGERGWFARFSDGTVGGHAPRLRAGAGLGAGLRADHAGHPGRDHRAQRLPVRRRAQGLLPPAGHRPAGRRHAGGPVDLVPGLARPPAPVRRHHRHRSGRAVGGRLRRRRRGAAAASCSCR